MSRIDRARAHLPDTIENHLLLCDSNGEVYAIFTELMAAFADAETELYRDVMGELVALLSDDDLPCGDETCPVCRARALIAGTELS